jgi:hypothetical protein
MGSPSKAGGRTENKKAPSIAGGAGGEVCLRSDETYRHAPRNAVVVVIVVVFSKNMDGSCHAGARGVKRVEPRRPCKTPRTPFVSNSGPMRVEPFVSVDGHSFAITPAELLRARGWPDRQGRNDVGLDEFDYIHIVFRFQECGRLEEVTAQAPVLSFGSLLVPFGNLESFIRNQDGAAFVRARFLVSPAFGLAFDPSERFWVTALAKHCLPQWEAL